MAKDDRIVELLAQVELFEDLSKAELRRIAAIAKPVDFAPGQSLTEEGTQCGRFYVIASGAARVRVRGRSRDVLGPADSCGEISLVDGGPRMATIVAETPLRTVSIAEFNFRSLLKNEPGIAYKVAVVLCRRLRAAERSAFTS